MFSKIKDSVKELAYQAVKISEETLSNSTGQEKKTCGNRICCFDTFTATNV